LIIANYYNLRSQTIFDKEYLFDDFNYSRLAFPASGDSSGSLFGKNPWITKKGIEYSRAWRRYQDTDSNTFRNGINISLDSNGVTLGITKDYKKESLYSPEIVSDFVFQEGTFAARIKFSKFNRDKLIQSFYQFSSVMFKFGDKNISDSYWSEFDFEYNNCWYEDNLPRMQVGCNNHNGKFPLYGLLNCITRNQNKFQSFDECIGNYFDYNFFADMWIIYVFRTNKLLNKMEIEAFPDDENLPFDFWGGTSSEPEYWGRSFQIPNYFPKYKLRTVLFIGACSDISESLSFSTDWFFYSPNPELSGSEILEQVKTLKNAGINRINTTQFPTYNEVSEYSPNNLMISGPTESSICTTSKWTIEPLYKGRHVYNIEFKYRIFSKNTTSDWNKVYKPELIYKPELSDDSLEIQIIYKDDWIQDAETLSYKCSFLKVPCQDLDNHLQILSLHPNPCINDISLEVEIFNNTFLQVELFDIISGKIKDIYKGEIDFGKHKFNIQTDNLKIGSYYIRAQTSGGTKVCNFIKIE
jgi:hypothetical protein